MAPTYKTYGLSVTKTTYTDAEVFEYLRNNPFSDVRWVNARTGEPVTFGISNQ